MTGVPLRPVSVRRRTAANHTPYRRVKSRSGESRYRVRRKGFQTLIDTTFIGEDIGRTPLDHSWTAPHRSLDTLFDRLDFSTRALAVCRITDGWKIDFQVLNRPILLHFFEGEGIMELGGHQSKVAKHHVILVPPSQKSRLCITVTATPHIPAKLATISFDDGTKIVEAGDKPFGLKFVCGEVEPFGSGATLLLAGLRGPLHGDLSATPAMRELCASLAVEIARNGSGLNAFASTMLKHSVVLVLQHQVAQGTFDAPWASGLRDPGLVRALAKMLTAPETDYSLSALAQEAQMSRSVFADRFENSFGKGPLSMLREIRLRTAAHLLRETQCSVKEAARQVGYKSRSHFSRAFVDRFGVAPSEWVKI